MEELIPQTVAVNLFIQTFEGLSRLARNPFSNDISHAADRIQKWYTIYKDHVTLEDYEIHDGMGLELYYN